MEVDRPEKDVASVVSHFSLIAVTVAQMCGAHCVKALGGAYIM